MAQPVFKHPELFQQQPMRDYFRLHMPPGPEGFVAEDLDHLIRLYGGNFGLDSIGRLMFVEQKYPGSYIKTAQEKTFGLLHKLLRKADPDRERYLGYYVLNVRFEEDGKPHFPVQVNKKYWLREADFRKWMTGEKILPSLFDEE